MLFDEWATTRLVHETNHTCQMTTAHETQRFGSGVRYILTGGQREVLRWSAEHNLSLRDWHWLQTLPEPDGTLLRVYELIDGLHSGDRIARTVRREEITQEQQERILAARIRVRADAKLGETTPQRIVDLAES